MRVVCGFHVYKDVWVPVLHEGLQTKKELDCLTMKKIGMLLQLSRLPVLVLTK